MDFTTYYTIHFSQKKKIIFLNGSTVPLFPPAHLLLARPEPAQEGNLLGLAPSSRVAGTAAGDWRNPRRRRLLPLCGTLSLADLSRASDEQARM
jgi:hypothetical protein